MGINNKTTRNDNATILRTPSILHSYAGIQSSIHSFSHSFICMWTTIQWSSERLFFCTSRLDDWRLDAASGALALCDRACQCFRVDGEGSLLRWVQEWAQKQVQCDVMLWGIQRRGCCLQMMLILLKFIRWHGWHGGLVAAWSHCLCCKLKCFLFFILMFFLAGWPTIRLVDSFVAFTQKLCCCLFVGS